VPDPGPDALLDRLQRDRGILPRPDLMEVDDLHGLSLASSWTISIVPCALVVRLSAALHGLFEIFLGQLDADQLVELARLHVDAARLADGDIVAAPALTCTGG